MSYHIYNTDGIVLKRVNFGESNALFYILTADLGLIISSAQAVRSHLSKLNSAFWLLLNKPH
jgi:recombinational DNA repair protein (RecF pathway)